MAYTDIDKPSDYFETALWTGNGSTTNITSLDFQPDFTWIKGRSDAIAHVVFDSVRSAGGNKELTPNETYAEGGNSTISYGFLSSFNSDGFTVRNGTSSPNQADYTNKNSSTYASWNWKAGTSFTNDASATGIGSIDSTGSVNQDAGFSIVSYTGTGSTGTVAHGLGATPSMMIFKERADDAHGWITYHHKNTSAPATEFLLLNTTQATEDYADYFNDTAPTSSVFTIDTAGDINGSSDTYIAYCFAEKQGYSKFGSYTGNGNADGTFVYTGFKPAWVLIKWVGGTSDWYIYDNKINPFNVMSKVFAPNIANAEITTSRLMDFTSNGFKNRGSGNTTNASGENYIYMAFAENPFVTSTGVPATAR